MYLHGEDCGGCYVNGRMTVPWFEGEYDDVTASEVEALKASHVCRKAA